MFNEDLVHYYWVISMEFPWGNFTSTDVNDGCVSSYFCCCSQLNFYMWYQYFRFLHFKIDAPKLMETMNKVTIARWSTLKIWLTLFNKVRQSDDASSSCICFMCSIWVFAVFPVVLTTLCCLCRSWWMKYHLVTRCHERNDSLSLY